MNRCLTACADEMLAKPVIVETAISNADRVKIEAGFMKRDEKLASYSHLFTNEFVQ